MGVWLVKSTWTPPRNFYVLVSGKSSQGWHSGSKDEGWHFSRIQHSLWHYIVLSVPNQVEFLRSLLAWDHSLESVPGPGQYWSSYSREQGGDMLENGRPTISVFYIPMAMGSIPTQLGMPPIDHVWSLQCALVESYKKLPGWGLIHPHETEKSNHLVAISFYLQYL